jgi:hypothetical protein
MEGKTTILVRVRIAKIKVGGRLGGGAATKPAGFIAPEHVLQFKGCLHVGILSAGDKICRFFPLSGAIRSVVIVIVAWDSE